MRFQPLRRRALAALFLTSAALSQATVASAATLPENVARDMASPGEVQPAGVPPWYDWATKPRVGRGNDASGYRAFVPWGQVYECATGNPQPAAQAELFDLRGFVLSKAHKKWLALTNTGRIEGAAYRQDFAGDINVPAAVNITATTAQLTLTKGLNFHFWPAANRATIDPADVAGVTVLMKARLVSGTVNPRLPHPCLALSVGADYWTSVDASWNSYSTNSDVAIGRFKRIDTGWRTFSMTTVSQQVLEQYPVPFYAPTSSLR